MDRTKSYFKYILALLLFGSNGVISSHIALSSYQIVWLRTMIGSILLIALFLLVKGRFTFLQKKKDFFFLAVSGAAMGISWMFLYEAYQRIGVSLSSLLYYCAPVIVMVLSPVLFREKLTVPKVSGFLLVLAGVILVNGKVAAEGENRWGLFCAGMSAVMFACLVICNKKASRITGMENSTLQLTISFLTVAVIVGLRQGFPAHIPLESWPWILFLGLVNTGFGCYLYFSSIDALPVQTVAICGYLEPMSAVVFSVLLLGESMTLLQTIGAILIIGGALLESLWEAHSVSAKETLKC